MDGNTEQYNFLGGYRILITNNLLLQVCLPSLHIKCIVPVLLMKPCA